MLRSVVSKVVWVGRATVFLMGLALMLALVFGIASRALGANGSNFILSSLNNTATALTRLTGSVNGSAMQIVNNNADANDSALSLSVQSGEAPMKVNSSAKVAHLNSDKLDNSDSSDFIQRNPPAAENGSIHIDGTVRTGSETGTSQGPDTNLGPSYNGLVVRRIVSTDMVRLERDGTNSGMQIAWPAGVVTHNSASCTGSTSSGTPFAAYIHSAGGASAGTAQLFTDAHNVVYATCSFGDPFDAIHVTQVTLQRRSGDNRWVGTVISTFNQ